MKRISGVLSSALLCAALVPASPAMAAFYTYLGTNYDEIIDDPGYFGTYSIAMSLVVRIELPNPLPANMPYTEITSDILALTIDDGRYLYSQSAAELVALASHVRVGTDADGKIDNWSINILNQYVPPGFTGYYAQSYPTFDHVSAGTCLLPGPGGVCAEAVIDHGWRNGSVGSWAEQCGNGGDDDGDGLIDLLDPGCSSATDPSETHLRPGDVLAAQDDGGIAALDPSTTRLQGLAEPGTLASTRDLQIDSDGRILATDWLGENLVEIDAESGLGTVISTFSPRQPYGLALVDANTALVSTGNGAQLTSVDLSTGTQTTVANDFLGLSSDILFDPADDSLLSSISDGAGLFHYDDPISDATRSSVATSLITAPRQMVFDSPTSIVVADSVDDLPYRLDLGTSLETPLLSFSPFNFPRGVTKEDDGLYLCSDLSDGKIVRVSEANDTATVLDPGSRGPLQFLFTVPDDYDLTLELADTILVDGGTLDEVDVGDTLELTAVVTNEGSNTADLLSLESGLDPNLTLVASSLSTTQGTIVEGSLASDPRLEVDLGSLAPAASATVTVTWQVVVSDPAPQRAVTANAWIRREKLILAESDDPSTGPARDPNVIGVGEYGFVVQAVRKISDTRGELSGPGNPGTVLSDGGEFGGALEPIGDVDGDGVADVIVGAARDDETGAEFGAFYILLLNADGSVKERLKWSAASPDLASAISAAGLPALSNDRLGSALAYLGDLDGAGPADFALAVGAWYDDGLGGSNRGAVYILFMQADPLVVLSAAKIGDGVGGMPTGQLGDNDYFGKDVANVGDVDGDGVVDLGVGQHQLDTFGTNAGGVWILFLNADGTVKPPVLTDQPIFVGYPGDFFGMAIASLGLFDGDAVPDIAVGASASNFGEGELQILTLNSDGTIKTHTTIGHGTGGFPLVPFGDDDRFGRDLAVLPDLDADGTVELAVGANRNSGRGFRAGAAYVLFLTPSGTTDRVEQLAPAPGVLFHEVESGDRFGLSLANLGDLDGDGSPELAVGAIRDDDGETNRGAVYILHTATPLPEPGFLLGLASGIAFLAAIGRKRIRH